MWQNELTGDRHGTGKWRGGFGGIYKVEYRHGCEAAEVGQGHFDYATPTGLFGGGSPPPSSPRVRHKDGTVEDIDVNVFWTVKDGDVYEQEMQGGGGYGDPLERDPEMVQKDVDDEFVTIEEAKEAHGVILKPMAEQPWRWEVNYEATEEERKRLKS
jgi:N-methylhydantoinase B